MSRRVLYPKETPPPCMNHPAMSGGISNILEAATSLLATNTDSGREKKPTPVDVVFQFAVSKICLDKIFQTSSPQILVSLMVINPMGFLF